MPMQFGKNVSLRSYPDSLHETCVLVHLVRNDALREQARDPTPDPPLLFFSKRGPTQSISDIRLHDLAEGEFGILLNELNADLRAGGVVLRDPLNHLPDNRH